MVAPATLTHLETSRTIRFDRNEISGAFGDLGTDFPLLLAMILAAKLDAASVLIVYGIMQIATALAYRMPMPVQPLKAVAAIVITQKIPAAMIFGGGLAIGLTMLVLSITGLLDLLARIIPKAVVRGIQFGLGLQLATLATKQYVPSLGMEGYVLAALALGITILLLGNRRFPPAIPVIVLGVLFALLTGRVSSLQGVAPGFALPEFQLPDWSMVVSGFVLLALPQIPLSLGNSVLATRQIAHDLFPDREPPTVRRIGFTYSLMNIIAPFAGGIPTCHGSGGMMGHYAFGGRTGGSVVIYGLFYLTLGLFFSAAFAGVAGVFPLPVLGVLLFVEGSALMLLIRDLIDDGADFALAVFTGLLAFGLPYGYLVALIVGTLLAPLVRSGRVRLQK